MGECRRDGPWTIGAHHTAFALLGSVVLDLCEVRFPAGEVVIDASAVMGGVEVRRTGPPGDRRAAIGSNP